MPTITIGSTIIDFPNSSSDPNWSPPVIEFAEAVADTLNSLVTAGDILPDNFSLDSYNGSTVAIPGFVLDTTLVRGATIKYAIIRERDTTHLTEYGNIFAVYNADGSPGSKWELSREFVADSEVTFSMADTGQLSITLSTIAGSGAHTGLISYSAQALLQN